MSQTYKIKKGLDIILKGTAEKGISDHVKPGLYALKPSDFRGLVPRLVVKEGDAVKAGTPLFVDKNREAVCFTSPVSGTVKAINRGERRVILEVVVESDGQSQHESFTTGDPLQLDSLSVKTTLLSSGLWPAIRQRPYNTIANPEDKPKAIFISAFDSAPLAPDTDFVLVGSEKDFQTGLNALSRLTAGRVHVNIHEKQNRLSLYEGLQNAVVSRFSGPHPAGNISVQVQRIDPINKGEVVWHVIPQHVTAIGRLFTTGKYDISSILAVTGSEVLRPGYVKTLTGARVQSIVEGNLSPIHKRFISGNPLTGTRVEAEGYTGFYDTQITVIPEGDEPEFLGWALPGFDKYSFSRSFWSWLRPRNAWVLNTNLHGGNRPFVITGIYEKVFPMNIYPMQLLKSILAEDVEMMEKLGIYEVVEEDFALCEFICPSKTEMQSIVGKGIDLMMKEMS
jgi:Na+-transporting NADH:ubiquinone oxidoreductase subunit A